MGKKYPEEEREIIRAKQLGVVFRPRRKTQAQQIMAAVNRPFVNRWREEAEDERDYPEQIRRSQDEWIKTCRPVVPKRAVRWVFDLGAA